MFWRDLALAWRTAWSVVAHVYQWDFDARTWEHVAAMPGDRGLLDGFDLGVFAFVRDGETPYYIQRRGYSSGGGSLPHGVGALPAERSAA